MDRRIYTRYFHDILDQYNNIHGTAAQLCLFCGADTYDSQVGIVHSTRCLIITLRRKLEE